GHRLNLEPRIGEGSDQGAFLDLFGGQNLALQHDAQSLNGRVDSHGRSIKPEFVTSLDARTGDFSQVIGPGERIGGVYQRNLAEIAWLSKPIPLNQSRAAQGTQTFDQ